MKQKTYGVLLLLSIIVLVVITIFTPRPNNKHYYSAKDARGKDITLYQHRPADALKQGDTVTFSIALGSRYQIIRKGYREGIYIDKRFAIIKSIY